MWVKINNAYYIFFDKVLSLVCFAVPLNVGKHGVVQQIVARLMQSALAVSYTQSRGNKIIPLLSLTCSHKCQLVFYGCSNSNM